jgi:hypothetical protein
VPIGSYGRAEPTTSDLAIFADLERVVRATRSPLWSRSVAREALLLGSPGRENEQRKAEQHAAEERPLFAARCDRGVGEKERHRRKGPSRKHESCGRQSPADTLPLEKRPDERGSHTECCSCCGEDGASFPGIRRDSDKARVQQQEGENRRGEPNVRGPLQGFACSIAELRHAAILPGPYVIMRARIGSYVRSRAITRCSACASLPNA